MEREEANKIMNEYCSKLEAAIVKQDADAIRKLREEFNRVAAFRSDFEILKELKTLLIRADYFLTNNLVEVA